MRNRGGNHHALKVFIVLALSLCVAALRPPNQAAPANAEMRNLNLERGPFGSVPAAAVIGGAILSLAALQSGMVGDVPAVTNFSNLLTPRHGLATLRNEFLYARKELLRMTQTPQKKKQNQKDLGAPVSYKYNQALSFLKELGDIQRNRLAEVWRDEVTNAYLSTYGYTVNQEYHETNDAFKKRMGNMLLRRMTLDNVPEELANDLVTKITETTWRLQESEKRFYNSAMAWEPGQPSLGYLFYDIGVVCKDVGPEGTPSCGVAGEVAGFNFENFRRTKVLETVTHRRPKFETETETVETGWMFSWPVNITKEVRIEQVTSETNTVWKNRPLNKLEQDELAQAAVLAVKKKTYELLAPVDSAE